MIRTVIADGCKQVCRDDCVIDIDVTPGTKKVCLGGMGIKKVELRKVLKQFPDVDELEIEESVSTIDISNFMFPNVTIVRSKSSFFDDNVPYLGYRSSLYNAFCLPADRILDLKKIIFVKNYALEGCRTELLNNVDSELSVDVDALHGYAGTLYCSTLKCLGNTVIGLGESKSVIELPSNVSRISYGVTIPRNCRIRVNSETNLIALYQYSRGGKGECFEELRLALPNSTVALKMIRFAIGTMFNARNVTVTENPFCISINGMLCSKDGKMLIYCPARKEGFVSIPEGIETINRIAFHCCTRITGVDLPESLRVIESGAFDSCISLWKVNFNRKLQVIGDRAFYNCKSLETVEIPPYIKTIGDSAFRYCSSLFSVKLNEGLDEIESRAFEDTPSLKGIEIPRSVRKLGQQVFSSLDRIYLRNNKVPIGFFDAVCCQENANEKVIECSLRSGRKFFVPAYVMKTSKIDEGGLVELFAESEDILDFSYEFAYSKKAKYDCAINTYKATGREEIKKYLKRVSRSVANTYLQANDEENLVEFLKLGISNKNTLQYVLDEAKEKSLVTVCYYVIDILKDNPKSFRL